MALLASALSSSGQFKEQNKSLDAFIKTGIEDWKIPGLAVVVVKDGELAFKESYGITSVRKKEKVNSQTLFAMASTTKAFIAISFGMLVDEGKLTWDDKLIDHYPGFKLSSPYVTANATIRDMLRHNIGLGKDAGAIESADPINEAISALENAGMDYSFRGGWDYMNIMYALAGEIIYNISGKKWNVFVKERILDPLKMDRTLTTRSELSTATNVAFAHFNDLDSGVVQIKSDFPEQLGAAGSMESCVDDIEKYLYFLLSDGEVNGKKLLKKETMEELFTPQALLYESTYPSSELTDYHWSSYALGWFQNDYHGEKLDFHTGSLIGEIAICGLIRDENFGVYVFANLDHAELRHAIMYKAIDLYVFNDDSKDWHTPIFGQGLKKRAARSEYKKQLLASQIKNTKPTLELSKYVGVFQADMGAKVEVSFKNDKLYFFHTFTREVELGHFHYDSFLNKKSFECPYEFIISFDIDQLGEVEVVHMWGLEYKKV